MRFELFVNGLGDAGLLLSFISSGRPQSMVDWVNENFFHFGKSRVFISRLQRAKRKEGRSSRQRRTAPLLVQPIADLTGNVPCLICGHLIDAKRIHPHMVRFHGASLRSKAPTLREW
jgi:hypothetical protein